MRDTGSWTANVIATFLLVAAWGYIMYQGAIDPEGIAKSLWPIFGIANQLLAVIAFCLGTTILIKMGKARYAWCTAVPMVFLTVVTFTAGIMKIWSPKAAGFLPAIARLEPGIAELKSAIAGGLTGDALDKAQASLAKAQMSLTNAKVDVAITAMFLIFVSIIVAGCAREWWLLLRKQKPVVLHESEYVALTD
jgi:carbon starvation protein